MVDIMFITLINYIREHGKQGIATIENDILRDRINVVNTKSRLLIESGFITGDINKSLHMNKKDNLKKFMAENEYSYTNNLFHKTLKFIVKNNYGKYYNTYKLCNYEKRNYTVLSDIYDIAIIDTIKSKLFKHLGLFKDDWSKYIKLINNKDTRAAILEHTLNLFNEYRNLIEVNEHVESFFKRHKSNFDIIYPAYIISIFDYEENNEDIDNYISEKVSKLNFNKLDYIEQRSQKGIYKNTYERIINNYNDAEAIESDLDKELFELIQNEDYFEKIQTQLYKWYTLSIFDKHNKTKYINKKQEKKEINKMNKEHRNQQIYFLKDEGFTQKEVAEMLNIGLRTVQRLWNK